MATPREVTADVIAQDEGGWVLSQDKDGQDGGWTFGGVTAKVWNTYYIVAPEHKANYVQMVELVKTQFNYLQTGVIDIYTKNYWNEANCSEVDPDMQQAYFSCVINCGPEEAIKILQRSFQYLHNAPIVDGIFGPETASLAKEFMDGEKLLFTINWIKFYIDCCVKQPEKLQFMEGWFNRVDRYIAVISEGIK